MLQCNPGPCKADVGYNNLPLYVHEIRQGSSKCTNVLISGIASQNFPGLIRIFPTATEFSRQVPILSDEKNPIFPDIFLRSYLRTGVSCLGTSPPLSPTPTPRFRPPPPPDPAPPFCPVGPVERSFPQLASCTKRPNLQTQSPNFCRHNHRILQTATQFRRQNNQVLPTATEFCRHNHRISPTATEFRRQLPIFADRITEFSRHDRSGKRAHLFTVSTFQGRWLRRCNPRNALRRRFNVLASGCEVDMPGCPLHSHPLPW